MPANATPSNAIVLDFERPLQQLEQQIAELESHAGEQGHDIASEIRELKQNHNALLKKTYAQISAWNTIKVARHPRRPQSIDYIQGIVKEFCELHGDRHYGEDPAIITGFGRIGPHKCMIVAHNKGKNLKERIACHFGCAHPEGYRKALLKMKLAEKYNVPIVTLVDTPGAYPGIGAEERGQAEAIAVNLMEMSRLKVPVVSVVIGEGGSGGALGIAVSDRVAMMQYAWYSVISPEGCSAILWKTDKATAEAAEALKLTAADNLRLGTIDEIIDEPMGGAHRDADEAAASLENWIISTLRDLAKLPVETLLERRMARLRNMGRYAE